MPTLSLKSNKVPQPYLKHNGSGTKEKRKFLKLRFKKLCHTKIVGDGEIIVTYLNSGWKNA